MKIKEIVKDPVELIVKEIRRMINVKYINLNDMRNRLNYDCIFQHRLLENESLVKIHQRYWINIDSMMVLMLIFGWEGVNKAMDQSRLVSNSLG